ncbi:MAG: PDZ domain-containing protein [Pirellulaceae bacterium]
MRTLSQKLRFGALAMCMAMAAGVAMENSAEAQRCRKGGGGGHVQRHGGGGGGGGHCHSRRRRDCHSPRQDCHRPRPRISLPPPTGHCNNPPPRLHDHHGPHHNWRQHCEHYYQTHRVYDCDWRHRRCDYVRGRRHLHWSYDRWCGYYPPECHWWYGYCGTDYYVDPSFSVTHDWNYYDCGGYQWHLGLSCIYIPGRGYGIQEVYTGSPAYQAGLQPGMIITSANGMRMLEENSMPQLLNNSNGRMDLNIITDGSGQPSRVGFDMSRVGTDMTRIGT